MAQEYGVFLVGLKIDFKPDTGEFVAYVTLQIEAFGVSKRVRRQVAAISLANLYLLIEQLIANIIIVKRLPYPEWLGTAPDGYVAEYTGTVAVEPILSTGVPETLLLHATPPAYDLSLYDPPPEA